MTPPVEAILEDILQTHISDYSATARLERVEQSRRDRAREWDREISHTPADAVGDDVDAPHVVADGGWNPREAER